MGTTAATTWARGEDLTYDLVQIGLMGLFVLVLLCLPKLMGPLVHHSWAVGMADSTGRRNTFLESEVFDDGDGGLEQEDRRCARGRASAVARRSGAAAADALTRAT